MGQEAWVAAAGRFNPCCAPDALRRTLGDFGNVSQESLYHIWQSEAYQELRTSLHAATTVPGLQYAKAGGYMTQWQWKADLERDGFVHLPQVLGAEEVDRLATLALQSVSDYATSEDLIRTEGEHAAQTAVPAQQIP